MYFDLLIVKAARMSGPVYLSQKRGEKRFVGAAYWTRFHGRRAYRDTERHLKLDTAKKWGNHSRKRLKSGPPVLALIARGSATRGDAECY